MRTLLFSVLFCLYFTTNAQVSNVVLECKDGEACFSEMKNATVHVIIKDFCDDSKPFKQILEKNWKYSNLKFDYEEKFKNVDENPKECVIGEWYMYIERSIGSTPHRAGGNYSNFTCTSLSVAKAVGKKRPEFQNVLYIPLFPAPSEPVSVPRAFIVQDVDMAREFYNISTEYYFANILQVLDQFVQNNVSDYVQYSRDKVKCDDLKQILSTTLYVPQYVMLKSSLHGDKIEFLNPTEYFTGYGGTYSVLSNDEMSKMFKEKKSFYYLLWAAEGGIKYNFIIESLTGKIMSVGYGRGYNINKKDMPGMYEKDLKNNENCK